MADEKLRARLKKAKDKCKPCLQKAAWSTCKCVLYAICCPCICCALCFLSPGRCTRPQRGGYARCPKKPQFPTPRPRALSLPLNDGRPEQLTSDQSQSTFITKLPLELRRMVYAEVLGGQTIHLQTYDGRPSAKLCPEEGRCTCDYFEPLMEKRLDFNLALLRTCRVMYVLSHIFRRPTC
jgi:hypothetical protein